MQTYYFKEFDVWLPYPEEWKPIKDFEGLYEISNYGRVKSVIKRYGNMDIVLKLSKLVTGYYFATLYKDKKPKSIKISLLVWDHFGDKPRNGRTLQVDHKDNIKTHDWIWNLQLLSQRDNISKGFKCKKTSSKYTGVDKNHNKWRASIGINGRKRHLGLFENEYDAHLAYQKALKELK